MLIRADLKCYYCGHVTGQIEGDTSRPLQTATYFPTPGNHPHKPGEQIRCGRCRGPVYMDDVETIRPKKARIRVHDDEEVAQSTTR